MEGPGPGASGKMPAVNLLALETSTRRLSVALWRDGEVREIAEDHPNGGSERLLPWVKELLAQAGLTLRQLDAIAFGAGPGGFTGLRLSCGIAQGLAFGLDRPVLAVGSLEALALASGEEWVFACLDARMNEVYCAAYRVRDGFPEEVHAPIVVPPSLVVAPKDAGWVGCGDGFASYGPLLPVFGQVRDDLLPTAAAVARLAAPRILVGGGVGAAEAAPLYVRDKVALTTAERLARGGVR